LACLEVYTLEPRDDELSEGDGDRQRPILIVT
jgi:hypothetical protein